MSSEEPTKKHWVPHLPGILTGSAALLAALTGIYINVRNDKPAVVASGVDVSTITKPALNPSLKPSVSPATPTMQSVDLKLNRLRIDNDGSMGVTDWTFDVQQGERSLFSVPFKGLSDKPGENLVTPADPELVHANLVKSIDTSVDITVHGWKQAWSGRGKEPDVVGQAKLNTDGSGTTILVKSKQSDGPAFVLYFDARAQAK
jgi:hypothetical protein